MEFKASPYNSIQMYLLAEEIIRGDCHNKLNPFQWDSLMTNLPGEPGYKRLKAWISKRRYDNSLARNFFCFVDNQRTMGQTCERVIKAGHAISTHESYLGL